MDTVCDIKKNTALDFVWLLNILYHVLLHVWRMKRVSAIFQKLRVDQQQTGEMPLGYKTKGKMDWRACLTYHETLQDEMQEVLIGFMDPCSCCLNVMNGAETCI